MGAHWAYAALCWGVSLKRMLGWVAIIVAVGVVLWLTGSNSPLR